MKNKILSIIAVFAMALSFSVSVNAEKTVKISVDERELYFDDVSPFINKESGKTLIPLRFVLESAGARVSWNNSDRTVIVDSGDSRNRVMLTIGSNEMKMYFYPSIYTQVTDTKVLEQAPIIVNDRTMIPVRDVLEGIGAIVNYDEQTQSIDIISRAYARFLRDMGVGGYEVIYPLCSDPSEFDVPLTPDKEYIAENEIPHISLSSDKEKATTGETINVYVNLKNTDKLSVEASLAQITSTLIYDRKVLSYTGYSMIDGDKEYSASSQAVNPKFLNNSLKIIAINEGEEMPVAKDGRVMKISFEVLKEETTAITLSNRNHSIFKMDNSIKFKAGEQSALFDDVNELYIDITPITIN